MIKLNTWSPVNEEETKRRGYHGAMLIYSGRAKDLVNESIKNGMLIKILPYNNHRLKITEDVVHCRTMITSKGDIIVAAEDDSYDSYDSSAVGNIMDKSLTDIIDTHQNNCVISCSESNYIAVQRLSNLYRERMDKPELFDIFTLKNALLYEINSSTLKLRQMLKKTYPILPAQDLIGELPMVIDDSNLNVLAMRIVSNTNWSVKKKLENRVGKLENKYASMTNCGTAQAVRTYCEAIAYMQDNGLSMVMKLRKMEMQILIDKAKSYSDGDAEPDNSGVFVCGESGIFANKNDVGEEYSKDRKMADFYRAMNEHSQMM